MNQSELPSHYATPFKKNQLELQCKANWDKFYRRNQSNFFRDRHWSAKELEELFPDIDLKRELVFLEAGCGVGNMLLPLREYFPKWSLHGVDFSSKAIQLLQERIEKEMGSEGDDKKATARCLDLTDVEAVDAIINVGGSTTTNDERLPPADIVSCVFVLSSIAPEKHAQVIRNLAKMVKPGGSVFFRDYHSEDHAMHRFGRGSKLQERFYTRADGTRAFYFIKDELIDLFCSCGFKSIRCELIHRKTINRKEEIEVDRIFIQGRFQLG